MWNLNKSGSWWPKLFFFIFFCGMAGPPQGSHTRDDISGLWLNYVVSLCMAVGNGTYFIYLFWTSSTLSPSVLWNLLLIFMYFTATQNHVVLWGLLCLSGCKMVSQNVGCIIYEVFWCFIFILCKVCVFYVQILTGKCVYSSY